jgi:hypothetical protein
MTKTLIAKQIIKNQYWIVTDGIQKVGNVISDGSGFDVKLNGNTVHFNNQTDIIKKTQIRFQPMKSNKTIAKIPYPEYPTTTKTYNNIFDIKRKLHLFTKSNKSKCYYAAGYYVMNTNGIKEVVFCPKYIFIQRYDYIGPYKTKDEAEKQINI